MYDLETREWGSATSQGKDLRDVTYANFFPVSMGSNFPIKASSTLAEYEHIQAISVGMGATYSLQLNQKDVESCPEKFQIFRAIRTWENARSANAFPGWVKKSWLIRLTNFTWKKHRLIPGNYTKRIWTAKIPGSFVPLTGMRITGSKGRSANE